MKATLYTIIALIAFAANSLLCRMALAESYIDAWSFTILRLLSGAICLSIIVIVHAQRLRSYSLSNAYTASAGNINSTSDFKSSSQSISIESILNDKGSWLSSLSLVIYALCFSLAYVELETGTGALILFSAVQLTMIGWGIYKKEQLTALQWLAFIIALAGFIYLMLPSAAVPSLLAATIMAISGVAWGIYSIRGQACISPLRATGFNFIRSLVAVPLLIVIAVSYIKEISVEGIVLASISGAVTSGIGYSIWYRAMPLLKSTQAAVVQFCVPVLAAIAGVVFLSEPLTMRFTIASAIILGAVLVFVLNKNDVKMSNEHKIRLYHR